ncbi:MAG: putative toxin-antitoxin system toxin component, PIN family [Silvibacterium sp.]
MNENSGWIVLDTNILVSWLLAGDSVSGQAAAKVVREKKHLASLEALSELADVLSRAKFDRYATVEQRNQFLRLVGRSAQMVSIVRRVHACRDPKDDKFLELAINGQAQLILTGDQDLLALHPFHGITIQAPAEYLANL